MEIGDGLFKRSNLNLDIGELRGRSESQRSAHVTLEDYNPYSATHLLCLLLTDSLRLLALVLGRLHALSQLVGGINLECTLLFSLGDLSISVDDTLRVQTERISQSVGRAI